MPRKSIRLCRSSWRPFATPGRPWSRCMSPPGSHASSSPMGTSGRVDIAADARLLPADRSALGLLLSVEELAVDKVLAVFGRAEARDFLDLAALEPRFG